MSRVDDLPAWGLAEHERRNWLGVVSVVLHPAIADGTNIAVDCSRMIASIQVITLKRQRVEIGRGTLMQLDLTIRTGVRASVTVGSLWTSGVEVISRLGLCIAVERSVGDDGAGVPDYLSSFIDKEVVRPSGVVPLQHWLYEGLMKDVIFLLNMRWVGNSRPQ